MLGPDEDAEDLAVPVVEVVRVLVDPVRPDGAEAEHPLVVGAGHQGPERVVGIGGAEVPAALCPGGDVQPGEHFGRHDLGVPRLPGPDVHLGDGQGVVG
ncbi:hypothetical protein Pen02_16040 [Plantactinospora endophytica]|uniref:Uncharacterized protein n=1 Tax=Plantactinospora endophytica TaxID=673535 RepID=A0ABQ4DW36_9ACTN|nr:hypothetical protein Pen02_16040 [Plantactinospora endophytica]